MKRRLEFRELKKKDRKELCHLLMEQEGYEEFFEREKDARIYAKAVAEQAIGTCAYKAVAAIDNHIVGAVIGCRVKNPGFWGGLKKKFSYLRLKIKKKNREVLECLAELEQMERAMLERNQVALQNMMVLFLTAKKYNNTEIQKNLLREWELYVKRHSLTSSYIVINGNRTHGSLEGYSKIDEKSAMIQPKVQRFRFHKSLYQKFV